MNFEKLEREYQTLDKNYKLLEEQRKTEFENSFSQIKVLEQEILKLRDDHKQTLLTMQEVKVDNAALRSENESKREMYDSTDKELRRLQDKY